jgi:hypothetical protein
LADRGGIAGLVAASALSGDGMSDEPKKRSRAWIWWAALTVLLAAYPLSIGPAFLLARKFGGAPVALMIYMPILGTLHRWPPIGRVVIWYLHLWGAF